MKYDSTIVPVNIMVIEYCHFPGERVKQMHPQDPLAPFILLMPYIKPLLLSYPSGFIS